MKQGIDKNEKMLNQGREELEMPEISRKDLSNIFQHLIQVAGLLYENQLLKINQSKPNKNIKNKSKE
jgi:hypothetical protein